jgi:hypothetical protein
MNEYALHTVFISPEQAKQAIAGAIGPYCRQQWERGIERLAVTIEPEEDDKTVKQDRYLWGVVYKEMAELGQIAGQKYSQQAYHELMKRMYLPRKKKVVYIAGRKRPVVTTTIGTTQGIGIARMAAFIDNVIAFAAESCGVVVSEPLPEHLRPQRRKAKNETIDAETGEILQAA